MVLRIHAVPRSIMTPNRNKGSGSQQSKRHFTRSAHNGSQMDWYQHPARIGDQTQAESHYAKLRFPVPIQPHSSPAPSIAIIRRPEKQRSNMTAREQLTEKILASKRKQGL